MEISKPLIDAGAGFDFGRTSEVYAKFRDIYPARMYERLSELGIGIAGQRVLDLGTGTGVLPRGMYHYGARWTGTDISENQIEQARRLSKGRSIEYLVCSAEEMDFADDSFDVVTAAQCFWYFEPGIVVPKIRRFLKPGGVFLKIYMSYVKEEPITHDSNSLVRKINGNWSGGNPAIADLKTHYFSDPQTEIIEADLPFTRETWHGRMLSSRGVLAAMNEDQVRQFDAEHRQMLEEKYPERFTVKHKIFLTSYRITKPQKGE
jgi:ubiquinone/menaquinone biosynthesis C-methylase UbiE